MMKRRAFVAAVPAAGLAGSAAAAPSTPRVNTKMHVGGDYHVVAGGKNTEMTTRRNLEYNLRHGIRHLTVKVLKNDATGAWDRGLLAWMRDNCDRAGVKMEAIRMPATYINQRTAADQERELDIVVRNVERAAEVGVEVITYHWTLIPIRRNKETPGRGGSFYKAFTLENDWKSLPVERSGRVSHAEYWERIEKFLKRVIPVAAQFKVKMACHPYDPPGLPFGYQGADNWDSPDVFAAIKRYEAIVESPWNGFQVCLGTIAEGLERPAAGVAPIVQYLGERGKIHQVHMRNIKGKLHDFQEVYPDEGVMNFFGITRILRDTGFSLSICPDHLPHHPDDPEGTEAFAYGYGYIQALIQGVNAELQRG
ncbi:MAG: mannonate dehydratase [Bryobacterales bacterium]|nr:mannonate dehydratase [Bryobacterales bacterium]